MAEKSVLTWDVEHEGSCPRGDDHAVSDIGGLAVGVTDPCPERSSREVQLGDLGDLEIGPEAGCLGSDVGHELRTRDAVREAREVLDVGGQHQLATRLVRRRGGLALDHDWAELGTGGVDGSGQAGGARSDDQDLGGLWH